MLWVVSGALFVGCPFGIVWPQGDGGAADGSGDGGGGSDGGTSDGGASDSGTPDAGGPDGGTPDAGGPVCPVIASMVGSDGSNLRPCIQRNVGDQDLVITGTGFSPTDSIRVTPSGPGAPPYSPSYDSPTQLTFTFSGTMGSVDCFTVRIEDGAGLCAETSDAFDYGFNCPASPANCP